MVELLHLLGVAELLPVQGLQLSLDTLPHPLRIKIFLVHGSPHILQGGATPDHLLGEPHHGCRVIVVEADEAVLALQDHVASLLGR